MADGTAAPRVCIPVSGFESTATVRMAVNGADTGDDIVRGGADGDDHVGIENNVGIIINMRAADSAHLQGVGVRCRI